MRAVGMGNKADDLILSMNRAAEAAVPEAKTLLVDAVKNMSVEDAKGILKVVKHLPQTFSAKKQRLR